MYSNHIHCTTYAEWTIPQYCLILINTFTWNNQYDLISGNTKDPFNTCTTAPQPPLSHIWHLTFAPYSDNIRCTVNVVRCSVYVRFTVYMEQLKFIPFPLHLKIFPGTYSQAMSDAVIIIAAHTCTLMCSIRSPCIYASRYIRIRVCIPIHISIHHIYK